MSAGIAYLDGPRIARGLRAGIQKVLADRDYLNKINVFPVPDGDTGTNLAMTMTAVLSSLDGHRITHAGRTLEQIADAALDGARGNSGAIMAQFFQGVSDACGEQVLVTTTGFVDAVEMGAQYARDALTEPREGTIVTVLSAFSSELKSIPNLPHDFTALLEQGLARARQALAETTDQLDELRKAGVVDAGARGFVDLLQGVTDFVREGSLREPVATIEVNSQTDDHEFIDTNMDHTEIEHRFCTECVITGDGIEHRRLKETLAGLGSSLVVAGTKRKVRVHIHVDQPQALFELAARFGTISSRKADDMLRQSNARHGLRDTVAIVTDSASDIPDEALERLNIHMVPVRVHFGNKSFLDKVSLSSDEFYAELEKNPHHPKTSQPAPGDFRRLYEFLGSHHPAILSIHLTGKASGTFQAAESAAARAHTETPIITVDSRNASIGQGLITMYAAKLAQAGCDIDDITIGLDRAIEGTKTFGLLGDLTYAVRGGRVPRSRKVVADLLRLNPVLKTFPDGRVSTGGLLLGRRNCVAKFARFITRRTDQSDEYIVGVGHAGDEAGANDLLGLLLDGIPKTKDHFITELGTALGAHGGRSTLVVALQKYEHVQDRAPSNPEPGARQEGHTRHTSDYV